MQDGPMQESMGPVADRTREPLGSADAAIIAARRRLLAEAKALSGADAAATPSGLHPSQQRVRSASMILPRDVPWVAATEESRKAMPAYYQHT